MTPTKSYIHKLNVARFEALLAQEQSAEHKRVLSKLLAEEQALLSESQRLEQPSKQSDDRLA